MTVYDVPTCPPEPPDATAHMAWCDRCSHWIECPCGCCYGWCSAGGEFCLPDDREECYLFCGVPPKQPDPIGVYW